MPKLRLLGVTVQPHFALDDGENLSPVDHPAVQIPAAEWPTYSSERFPAEVKAWQAELDAEAKGAAQPPANRQQRRATVKRKG